MEELIKLHYRTKNPSRGDITTEGSYYFYDNDCIYLITTLFQPSEGIREM